MASSPISAEPDDVIPARRKLLVCFGTGPSDGCAARFDEPLSSFGNTLLIPWLSSAPTSAILSGMTTPGTGSRSLGDSDFAVPIDDRYFEDYAVGAVYEYGYLSVTEDDIREYALRFDPQAIHVDPEFAARGPFGGLIASGWHTGSLMMRLLVDHYLSSVAGLASPGADEMRWSVPVRPGDALRLRTTTIEARPSRSKPDRGLIRTTIELLNQDDQVPLSLTAMNLMLRRDRARTGPGRA
jgi:acyl dehydratase